MTSPVPFSELLSTPMPFRPSHGHDGFVPHLENSMGRVSQGSAVPVIKKVRKDAQTVVVVISGGEYLQYLISSSAEQPRFALTDANTGEIILSDGVRPTLLTPSTFFRLWPVVGDLPQREASLTLEMSFTAPSTRYTFQVQHHQSDGAWRALIDIDFACPEMCEDFTYKFKVLAQ